MMLTVEETQEEIIDRLQTEGFARRMSEPLVFVPVYFTLEQEKAIEEKNGPMLTRDEKIHQNIISACISYGTKRKKPRTPFPYEEQYKDDPSYPPYFLE